MGVSHRRYVIYLLPRSCFKCARQLQPPHFDYFIDYKCGLLTFAPVQSSPVTFAREVKNEASVQFNAGSTTYTLRGPRAKPYNGAFFLFLSRGRRKFTPCQIDAARPASFLPVAASTVFRPKFFHCLLSSNVRNDSSARRLEARVSSHGLSSFGERKRPRANNFSGRESFEWNSRRVFIYYTRS